MKTLKAKMFKALYWTDNMLSKERKIQSIFSPLEVVSVKFRAIQTTHLKTLKKKKKEYVLWNQRDPFPPFTGCVTLAKELNLPEPFLKYWINS